MKYFLGFLLLFFCLINSGCSHTDKIAKKFTLQGEIENQDSCIIVLTYRSDKIIIYDTARTKNGKFVFTGKITEPSSATLNLENKLERVFVYLEPCKMKISLSKNNPPEFKMTGSKTQNESDSLNKMEKPFYDQIARLRDQKNKLSESLKNSKDDSAKILLGNKAEELDRLWSQTLKQIDSIQLKFVLENPKSFIAVVYLHMLGGNEVISLDSTKSILNGLDNSLKESSYGKSIIEDIRKKENVLTGAQAPDFKATALNNQTVMLSQFKGERVVLLDFWASWCVPCRQSLPHLKTIYNKYHSKGFDIIAVSLDENRKAWMEAVKQDSTDMWYHILIAEKWPEGPITATDIFQNYYFKMIPEQFLIDKNGNIIGRLTGQSKENEESLERQLAQLFDK
jgi:peroxiredoxin